MSDKSANSAVKTGSTVLSQRSYARLAGLNIGFIGNHTSNIADGTLTVIDMLRHGLKIKKLFSPEHGAFGRYDENVTDETDPITGLKVISLYGDHRKPQPEMLEDLDILVFEMQDVGARFYTYASTLLLAIDAAHESGKKLLVLDRPNPINGIHSEGSLADKDHLSFVASYTIPVRHGLTLGELALLCAGENNIQGVVEVQKCDEWRRNMWFDQTGLSWVRPSPAMKTLTTATLYPGVCLLEQTNVSVGRGTETPFELVGAPYIDGDELAARLAELRIPGIIVNRVTFVPARSKFIGEICGGIRFEIVDRLALKSTDLGIALLASIRDLYGASFDLQSAKTLIASKETLTRLQNGEAANSIVNSWEDQLRLWNSRRQGYLLYED